LSISTVSVLPESFHSFYNYHIPHRALAMTKVVDVRYSVLTIAILPSVVIARNSQSCILHLHLEDMEFEYSEVATQT